MKPFADLTNVEKVKAVYAERETPITLESALDFAGVALTDLTGEELDSILHDPRLKVTFDDRISSDVRMYSPEDRSLVLQELDIDLSEIKKHVMMDMWGDVFGSELMP